MTRLQWVALWLVLIVLATLAIVLGACGKPERVFPATCATYQAPDGTWMEEDNEPVDSDPCDLDDAWEFDGAGHKTPKPRVVKPSPAKPAPSPIGGRKKRF